MDGCQDPWATYHLTKLTEGGPATVGLVVQEPVGGSMPGTAARATESGLRLIPCSTLLMELTLQQTGMVGQEKEFTWDASTRKSGFPSSQSNGFLRRRRPLVGRDVGGSQESLLQALGSSSILQ